MHKFRQVSTLKTLCIQSYVDILLRLSSSIFEEIQKNPKSRTVCNRLRKTIQELSKTLETYVPWNLYDEVAEQMIQTFDNIIINESNASTEQFKYWVPKMKEEKELTRSNVLVTLCEVVFTSKLIRADVTRWSNGIRLAFYDNLYKMINLKTINFSCHLGEWRTIDRDVKILRSIQMMNNLRAICLRAACTDRIIKSIAHTCVNIKCIDVSHSQLVTDDSIRYLLDCQELEALQVFNTSITIIGQAKLISKLPKLRNFGRCNYFEFIAKCLDKRSYSNIKKLTINDMTSGDVKLLFQVFRKLEALSLYIHSRTKSLNKVIQNTSQLRSLELCNATQCMPDFYPFFESPSQKLTHLHLVYCQQLPVDVLVIIGNSCHLESLVISDCDFINPSYDTLKYRLNQDAFSTLEKLIWNVHESLNLLEVVLSKSINITHFLIGETPTFRHSNLEDILRENPMKLLKGLMILNSIDMDVTTVQLLIDTCPNLKAISGLETWQQFPQNKFDDFKDFIKRKNIDLDVTTFWETDPLCCDFQHNLVNYYS